VVYLRQVSAFYATADRAWRPGALRESLFLSPRCQVAKKQVGPLLAAIFHFFLYLIADFYYYLAKLAIGEESLQTPHRDQAAAT
jgi:hypothetical protein